MDAKINKTRLGHLLSYDWIKIILFIVVAVIVWSLIFTMTATRITITQTYSVVNYYGTYFGSKMNNLASYQNSLFSYEVIECSMVDVLAGGDGYVATLLETRLTTGEGDVLFAPAVNNPSSAVAKKDENGNEIKDANGQTEYEYTTYLQQFLQSSYFYSIQRLDDSETENGYFTQMKQYLAKFYAYTETDKTFSGVTMKVADFNEASFDYATAEQLFRERIQKNKDKRFKKEEQIQAALQDEYKRIQSYAEGYETIFKYLEEGVISFTHSSVQFSESVVREGFYSINVCPNEETMGGFKEYAFYYAKDSAGKNYSTAKDMNAIFLALDGLDLDFQYETVLLINQFVKECRA